MTAVLTLYESESLSTVMSYLEAFGFVERTGCA